MHSDHGVHITLIPDPTSPTEIRSRVSPDPNGVDFQSGETPLTALRVRVGGGFDNGAVRRNLLETQC